jgi:glucan phosphorylase
VGEGFSDANGWVIDGASRDRRRRRRRRDALYRLLEERDRARLLRSRRRPVPHRWMEFVKEAIRTVAPRFSARRMVKEYVERMYAPRSRKAVKSEAELSSVRPATADSLPPDQLFPLIGG